MKKCLRLCGKVVGIAIGFILGLFFLFWGIAKLQDHGWFKEWSASTAVASPTPAIISTKNSGPLKLTAKQRDSFVELEQKHLIVFDIPNQNVQVNPFMWMQIDGDVAHEKFARFISAECAARGGSTNVNIFDKLTGKNIARMENGIYTEFKQNEVSN